MSELRKCSWPTRGELYQSTILVVVSFAILSLFVAMVDEASRWLVRILTTSGM